MVPQHFDSQRILPQQQRRKKVRNHGLGDTGYRRRMRLTPADETGIGSHPHQQRLLLCRVGAEMAPLVAVQCPHPAARRLPVPDQNSRRPQPHFRHVIAVRDDMKRLHVRNLHPHIPSLAPSFPRKHVPYPDTGPESRPMPSPRTGPSTPSLSLGDGEGAGG